MSPVPPAPPGCAIRDAVVGDLPATARLHVRELPVGLFPRLGRRFVRRWHRAFLDSPHGVALSVVRVDSHGRERIVGFLVGATDRDAFLHDLITRHRTALLVRGVAALALRPWVLARFVRTRLRPYLRRLQRVGARSRGDASAAEAQHRAITGDLTAIVITPDLRQFGAGRALVEAFLHRCSASGTSAVELVTASGPASASGFYVRTGWTLIGQLVTRDGLAVQRFRRTTIQRAEGR